MRWSPGAVLAALALLVALPYDLLPYELPSGTASRGAGGAAESRAVGGGAAESPVAEGGEGADAERDARDDRPFGAECRSSVQGSTAVAYCHNPYPESDRVRLHIECDRWWDVDSDSRPVAAGPATTVRLTGRCWKEIRAVWVSHQR
ncbi:hypothetical protein [Streptomyces silvensis]|uniref:hypothetical protein n=1 Tax=Streptomyces silvensis TaxID=1765722 RepID=UPI001F5241A7|nr:hypothetical protein [Streptomyces silvensis]